MKHTTALRVGCFFLLALLFTAQADCCATTAPQVTSPHALSGKRKITSEYFSTICSLTIWDDFSDPAAELRFQEAWAQSKALLGEIERAVSVSDPASDVARFNAMEYGQSLTIGEHTANILAIAREAYEQTGCMYDPTVFPLVDLWGFSPRFGDVAAHESQPYDAPLLPDDKYIEAFARLADFSGVLLSDAPPYTLQKMIPPVIVDGRKYEAQMDLGGVAKGYAADQIIELLRRYGYAYGYFTCGGSSLRLLKSGAPEEDGDDGIFHLGINKPRGNAGGDVSYITLSAAMEGLSTSGDYSHYRIIEGYRYCHLLDPHSGWPANTPAEGNQRGIATATVIGGNAAYADCLSTALCIMIPSQAIRYINSELSDYRVALVLYDESSAFYELVTNMPQNTFTIDDEAYVLASYLDAQGHIVYTGMLFG